MKKFTANEMKFIAKKKKSNTTYWLAPFHQSRILEAAKRGEFFTTFTHHTMTPENIQLMRELGYQVTSFDRSTFFTKNIIYTVSWK